MYVIRSLFRDFVPDMSNSSQPITVNPPAELKTASQYKLVWVFIDVLSPEELAGCIPCDSEYLCSELLSEFGDDIMNLAKVKVRLLHSEPEVEEETIRTMVFSEDDDSEWGDESMGKDKNSGSELSSDCEDYVDDILREDLPRLGLMNMKWDHKDEAEPFKRQFSDENWPSHAIWFSHDTAFKGHDQEPVPSMITRQTGTLSVKEA
ncbi:hypothetical protein R1sor_009284 [Riccia sorocarpa]|uniref:Uncharacterized protein n=1 Tax=Riccia sorocarpa TaxID=122646 RepID=A0ABD3HUP2_9MARC